MAGAGGAGLPLLSGHTGAMPRDRNPQGRPENSRPRDGLGRPLPYGSTGVTPVPPGPRPPEQAIDVAQELLDRERPFQAHEVLEDQWKASGPGERDLWQGLAQLCVALTHQRRGNAKGATALAVRAAERVGGFADAPPHGLDVAGLVSWAGRLAEEPEGETPVPGLRG